MYIVVEAIKKMRITISFWKATVALQTVADAIVGVVQRLMCTAWKVSTAGQIVPI